MLFVLLLLVFRKRTRDNALLSPGIIDDLRWLCCVLCYFFGDLLVHDNHTVLPLKFERRFVDMRLGDCDARHVLEQGPSLRGKAV